MISLAKIFGKSDRFFTLLEDSAKSAHDSIHALEKLLNSTDGQVCLAELAVARRHEKRTAELISMELIQTFVTTLDREDIEELSRALYSIPKTVEKFGERYEVAHHLLESKDFAAQMTVAREVAAIVLNMVAMLSKSPKVEEIKAQNDLMQELEDRADAIILEKIKGIYSTSMDPFRAMALRDLYDLLEKVIDRCRDAANVVTLIVLKNS